MVTSVTSATFTATANLAGWGIALGAGGAILVIGLLIALEMLGATERPTVLIVRQLLRVATGPLLLVFVVSTATKVLSLLAQS